MRKALVVSGAFALGLVVIAACGSDNDDTAPPAADAGPDTANTSSSGFAFVDSGPPDAADSGPLPPAACPTYQTRCDGKCIPTTDDAEHCGGCTTKCTGTQACSAGKCSDTCQVGLEICANRCVDKQSDNAHCGTCGHACGAGDGCVAGNCVTSIPLGPAPDKCVGGGPAIVNTPEQGGCLGELAQTTFRWSLCSCTDVTFSAAMTADAYDSTKGPYAAGSTGGGVGVNNEEHSSGETKIGGDLWIHGPNGAGLSSVHLVRHDLKLNGPLSTSLDMTVENDAWINGNITASAPVKVTNELKVPADKTIAASVTAGKTTRAPVDFALPCDCEAKQLVPVTAIVQGHAGTNNDNAAINLKADALKNPGAPTRLDLPCGQFYLTDVGGAQPITIAAHGRTALYIEGNINTSGDLTFVVDAIGELDVFVTGSISSSKPLHIGSPNYPALSRTYIGSSSTFALSGDVRVAGNLWVGKGQITWSATSDLYGSLFAGGFNASSPTSIHYDRAVLQAGSTCPGGSASGGGDAGLTCTTCRDCANQACKAGHCGACETNADCCAPLQCSDGECISAVK